MAKVADVLQTLHCTYILSCQTLAPFEAAHNVLVSAYYKVQCFCNPTVGAKRGNHICLPLRQLAMAFHRLGVEPFAPTVITDETLKAVLSPKLPRAVQYKLEQQLVHRAFTALWQDPEILQLMRTQCLFCGALHSTADMALHLPRGAPMQS